MTFTTIRNSSKSQKPTQYMIPLLLALSILTILPIATSVFAQTSTNSELVRAETNGRIFQYGDTVKLTIEDINIGPQKDVTTMKEKYAGVVSPCGIDYVDFAMLSGDQSTIQTYDELAVLGDKSLNVVYSKPYQFYACPFGVFHGVSKASLEADSRHSTISYVTDNGQINMKRELITVYEIQNVYGKEALEKQISPEESIRYVDSQPLPVGKYTIIAFTLSGNISKPIVIEITNATGNAPQVVPGHTETVFPNGNSILPDVSLASLLTIPAMFGGVMFTSLRKTRNLASSFKLALALTIVTTVALPMSEANQAFAAYNVNSQGVEAHGTSTSFKSATAEDQWEGIQTAKGTGQGTSLFNNHFVKNFSVGKDMLWSQSFVQIETPTSATTNSHTCTTQSGTYTCKLPSTVNLVGVYNVWTFQNAGTCPTGFTPQPGGTCVDLGNGSIWGVTISSTKTRIDTNTFNQVQSTGKLYMDQKYRTCTGSTCSAYTTVYSHLTPVYATTSGYFGSQFIPPLSATYYGIVGPEGECGTCNGGAGRVSFLDGTYATQWYSTTSATPVYRASGDLNLPKEQNKDICWWDIISTGGSLHTTTYRYTAGCQS